MAWLLPRGGAVVTRRAPRDGAPGPSVTLRAVPAQPLTAPAVRPETSRRWTIRKNTTTGRVNRLEAAIVPPQSVPKTVWKVLSQIGRVYRVASRIITNAYRNSFHAVTKAKIEVATIPGASSGNTTRMKARSREAPSTIAASSTSRGSASTTPRRPRQHREKQRQQHRRQRHQQAVAQVVAEVGAVDRGAEVLQRERHRQPVRRVAEDVVGRLEGRGEHPVDGEGEEHQRHHSGQVGQQACGAPWSQPGTPLGFPGRFRRLTGPPVYGACSGCRR